MSDQQIQTKLDAASDRWLALAVDDGTTEDTYNRFELQADGQFDWGSGSAALDTNLYRSAADKLKTDDSLDVGAHDGSAAGLYLGGTLVTATAAEINRIADASARIVNVTASTLTVTQASHDGKVITLNRAAGIAVTLPQATGSGTWLRFQIGTTVTSNSTTIKVPAANPTDLMVGSALVAQDGGDTIVAFESAVGSANDTITLNGTTTGGIVGDWIELIDVASGQWQANLRMSATGTEATPFSATVS